MASKNKNLSFYLCVWLLSNTWHTSHPFSYPMSSSFNQANLFLYLNKNVSPQWLSLITKTRIRGLDALNLPFLVMDDNHLKEWYKKGFEFWKHVLFSKNINKRIEWMSPKQRNSENSPYTCAYNFHLISTHMHRYKYFEGVAPTK
jgi:hypothetical protein